MWLSVCVCVCARVCCVRDCVLGAPAHTPLSVCVCVCVASLTHSYRALHAWYHRYRVLTEVSPDRVVHTDPDKLFLREDTERDLVFAGFLIVSSPVKNDSLSTITKLKRWVAFLLAISTAPTLHIIAS